MLIASKCASNFFVVSCVDAVALVMVIFALTLDACGVDDNPGRLNGLRKIGLGHFLAGEMVPR